MHRNRGRPVVTVDRVPRDAETLQRLARKLEALSSDAVHIEHAVADIVSGGGKDVAPTLVHDLQRLDYLSQSLRDLARLTNALSLEEQDRARHLELIQLASTRALLHAQHTPQTHSSGTFDLF